MSSSDIFGKIFKSTIAFILLVGVSLAGFFVQSLHVVHASTMSQDSVITCAGGVHNTEKAPCPSVKYQNVVVAISSDSEKVSFEQNVDNHILPASTQNVVYVEESYEAARDLLSKSFEKRNRWVTQLPRAHLS